MNVFSQTFSLCSAVNFINIMLTNFSFERPFWHLFLHTCNYKKAAKMDVCSENLYVKCWWNRHLAELSSKNVVLSQGSYPPSKAISAAMSLSGFFEVLNFNRLRTSSFTVRPGKLRDHLNKTRHSKAKFTHPVSVLHSNFLLLALVFIYQGK